MDLRREAARHARRETVLIMKWIFALNADPVDSYGDYARVAVVSARRHSSLQGVCLFDGEECEFSRWLVGQGVEVVQVRSRFYHDIERIAHARNTPFFFQIGAGAFLRLEILRLARELDWNDEFVFYTDCDVIFRADPCPLLEDLRPQLFAAAPKTFKNKPLHMNTGAMWMNVRTLDDPELEAWTRANIEKRLDFRFDQGALRVFYNPAHRWAWRLGLSEKVFYSVMSRLPSRSWKWDELPLELNWKPYWEPNPNALLIHSHGLKPLQRADLAAGKLPPFLAGMHTPFFDECAALWGDWLWEARSA